jgi:low affinity Fe/Cu permease
MHWLDFLDQVENMAKKLAMMTGKHLDIAICLIMVSIAYFMAVG